MARTRTYQDLTDCCEPIPESGCLVWMRSCSPSGYGKVKVNNKDWRAHRLSWVQAKGPIPEGMNVLHRCDVRCCINPDHMFLGTHQDNVADKIKKGRQANGELISQSKLTADQVREIRQSNLSSRKEAAKYNVSHTLIKKIRRRDLWSHI